MIAIATMRLKLTSTAATLTVARRAVPRSWATASCRQAGPLNPSLANTNDAMLGVINTAPSNRQAIERYPGNGRPSTAGTPSNSAAARNSAAAVVRVTARGRR